MKTKMIRMMLGLALGLFCSGLVAADIANGNMEQAADNKPVGWITATWGGQAGFEYVKEGREGSWCVKMSSTEGADASWQTEVAVQPYARYRMSGWVKTQNLEKGQSRGALFNLHNIQEVASGAIDGTTDWTKLEMEFDTEGNDTIQINCLLGGWGLAKGAAWFDDISLQLLSQQEIKMDVKVLAGKAREPISPYIYGQFIEHLGRCIYGGIWAEMLEDRKFYYPVGDRQSPWKTQGEGAAVTMVKENAYVGEHTPELTANGAAAIVHSGLGLREKMGYEGRIVMSGDKAAGPVEVTLIWGADQKERQTVVIKKLTGEFAKYEFSFKCKKASDAGQLVIKPLGQGKLRIGAVSLMPADNVQGYRADVLELLKQLKAPVYRWPGGNFVSGYNWKDGIGDPDKRPPRKNPAWTGVEHNDVGIHEYMAFCKLIDTEPFVTVNTGLGTVEMATEEVEYANSAADTPMGKLRAQNGSPKPFKVKWWAVGNEMYGDWQLGHMPVENYVEKHNNTAAAMWMADPTIKLIAVGAVGGWDEVIMDKCAGFMDLVSEHFYCQERRGTAAHVAQIADNIRRICEAHRQYRRQFASLKDKDIRIAMDEWNYWYGPHVFGELGTRYFLRDGLGIASGLHEYFRQSDIVFMANYAQTVNVIGCIKTSKTAAEFETTGLVLKLYRQQFGTIPVDLEGQPRPLDVSAAWTEDHKTLTLAVVNPLNKEVKLPVQFAGVQLSGKGKLFVITGKDEMAYNDPGKPRVIDITEEKVVKLGSTLTIRPWSVMLYRLDAKPVEKK